MRFLPPFLVLVIALAGHLPAQINNDPITTVGTIPDKTIRATLGSPAIDLSLYFAVPSLTGQTVLQFATPGVGTFNVVMSATAAPNTVSNFLAYVAAGSFTNSFIHRSIPGVIQGGSYFIADSSLYAIDTAAPIAMETSDNLPNVAGTIAMARSGLNTATSGWFINVSDNVDFFFFII